MGADIRFSDCQSSRPLLSSIRVEMAALLTELLGDLHNVPEMWKMCLNMVTDTSGTFFWKFLKWMIKD